MFGSTTRFLVPADVVARVIGEETILVDLNGGRYYALDQTGSAVWDALNRTPAFGAIVGELRQRFSDPGDSIAADVDRLLADLVSRKLLLVEHE